MHTASNNFLRDALHKIAEDAPGLLDRSEGGDINKLRERVAKLTPYVLQRHRAEQAGPHYDLRLQSPEGLLSWAIPKTKLPASGEARRAIRQPLHSTDYKDFEGKIEEGYGRGEVSKEQAGNVLITDVEGDPIERIDFTVPGRDPERYRLSKQEDGDWLFLGMTPSKKPEHEKMHYDKVEEGEVDEMLSQVTEDRPMSVKIDGALGLLKFLDDKAEVMSHRTREDSDKPIIHTERVAPSLLQRREIPEELQGKTLEGELYATRDGKTLKPQEISGLLNSNIQKARERASEEGIDWRMALFDSLPRNESSEKKERILSVAVEALPDFAERPPQATNPQVAQEMLSSIIEGNNPLSSEGVVFDTEDGKKKYKPLKETDVITRGFTPGTGRLSDTIGAIQYALTPGGPIKGKVGTGLTDKMRRQISDNKSDWINRVARIQAQQQYPSGAFRAPVFKGFHEDYGPSEWGPAIEDRMGKSSSTMENARAAVKDFVKKTAVKPKEHVFLVGAPGSGKTTLAPEMADSLGLPLVHLDELSRSVGDNNKDWAEWKDLREVIDKHSDPALFEGAQLLGLEQEDLPDNSRFVVLEAPRDKLINRIIERGWDDEEGVLHQGEAERERAEAKIDEALDKLKHFKDNNSGQYESYSEINGEKAANAKGINGHITRVVRDLVKAAGAGSCGDETKEVKAVTFKPEDGDTEVVVKAEVADTLEKQRKGLMHRESLGDGHGMLFAYEEDGPKSFWMKDTTIPLDAAFLGPKGEVRSIKELQPESMEPVKHKAQYVLEVPQGWLASKGIGEGDVAVMGEPRQEKSAQKIGPGRILSEKEASGEGNNIREAVKDFVKAANSEDVYDKYNLDPEYEDVARTLHGESLHYTQDELNALAQVIRNRVKSGRHPDSPSEVVKKKWQFSPWNYRFQDQSEEDVKRVKRRMTRPLGKIPHLDRISKAIQRARKDKVDSVRGARHFHATSMDEKPEWAPKLLKRDYTTKEVGDHTFYLPPQSQQPQQSQQSQQVQQTQQNQIQPGSETTPSQDLGVDPVPRTHKVQPGENLSGIANKYGIPGWERIATHNEIEDADKIQSERVLDLKPFRRAGDYPE